jgi:hypothetical protein
MSSALDMKQKLEKYDPRYQAGQIYCICSSETSKIYIGSTIRTLEERMKEHVKEHVKQRSRKCKSSEVIMCGKYDITRICFFQCNNETELSLEEGRRIREFRESGYDVVNERMPGSIAMAGSWAEYRKQYEADHKQERADYKKKYKENAQKYTCECCNKAFNKYDIKNHRKTKKYMNYINNK